MSNLGQMIVDAIREWFEIHVDIFRLDYPFLRFVEFDSNEFIAYAVAYNQDGKYECDSFGIARYSFPQSGEYNFDAFLDDKEAFEWQSEGCAIELGNRDYYGDNISHEELQNYGELGILNTDKIVFGQPKHYKEMLRAPPPKRRLD